MEWFADITEAGVPCGPINTVQQGVRFAEEVGRGMRVAVPALVVLGVAQPEVGPDVDDRAALREPSARGLGGLARRQRREDDLRIPHLLPDDE